jgi:hypothetical protein
MQILDIYDLDGSTFRKLITVLYRCDPEQNSDITQSLVTHSVSGANVEREFDVLLSGSDVLRQLIQSSSQKGRWNMCMASGHSASLA